MEISKVLEYEIQERGYETKTGRVGFPKKMRDKYRAAIGDYASEEWEIKIKMIDIYNKQFGL